ncbi:hypothetical protein ATO12_00345 [Aquimarina atlantica]|uniref:Lipoprotein n=1 Tax=Aquimarina atlantica TaxID=1317122 RepID=A0A023BZ87_9FLAO|nr:hypothetical protein [Aquimarina atlantica]EZH75259.1 hypothetical protein ATO12_00345 [Aquimarina atlantica]
MRLTIIFIFLSLLSCNSIQEKKIEQEITECIQNKYGEYGIDFRSEILKFEFFLIQNKFLKNSSGKSYLSVFETLNDEFKLPERFDYKIEKLDQTNYEDFIECFYSRKNDPRLVKSKLKQIYNSLDNIHKKKKYKPSDLASAFTNNLSEKDFESELYKSFSLYVFYIMNFSYNLDKNIVKIEIRDDNVILLNEKEVDIENLTTKILELVKNENLKDYSFQLKVNGNSSMGMISDIKSKLNDLNSTKVEYQSN